MSTEHESTDAPSPIDRWGEIAEKHFGRPTMVGAHMTLFEARNVLSDILERMDTSIEYLEEDLAIDRGVSPSEQDPDDIRDALAFVRAAEQLLDRAAHLIVRVFPT